MKDKLTIHANERYFDRSSQEVTRKMLINHIDNGGEILYALRLTASRSLAYIIIREEVFKVIINRKSKKLISILPFKEEFAVNIIFFSEHYDNKYYLVKLFPDCFHETKGRKQALTKIYELDDKKEIKKELDYHHPFFTGLFDAAVNLYMGTKRISKNAENKANAKTKTIVFKKPQIYTEPKACTL